MPKAADPPKPVVLIQAIRTRWEKSERGGPSAAQRNQVPEALKLPHFNPVAAPLSSVVHRADYSSKNGFAEPTKSIVDVLTTEPSNLGGVSLAVDDDELAVFYQYSRSQGAPEHYSRKIEALNLSLNQWGSVSYNGRHSGLEGYWWYGKWIYNIGLFSLPSLPIFVTTKPVNIFTQMAHLW